MPVRCYGEGRRPASCWISMTISVGDSQPSPLALPDLPYVFLAKYSGGLWCGADLPESRVSVTPRSRLLGIQRSWNPRNRDLLSCQCNWNKQIPRISKFQLPETGRWVGKQERNSRFLSMSPGVASKDVCEQAFVACCLGRHPPLEAVCPALHQSSDQNE